MPKSHPPYPEEFWRQLFDLDRSGRTPESLAQDLEPTAQSIRKWVAQAGRDEGLRGDGLTSAERAELTKLRGEDRRLRQERELLQKSRFQNHAEARRALFELIEGWYNPRRRHQSLGQVAPIEIEKGYAEASSNPEPELSTEAG